MTKARQSSWTRDSSVPHAAPPSTRSVIGKLVCEAGFYIDWGPKEDPQHLDGCHLLGGARFFCADPRARGRREAGRGHRLRAPRLELGVAEGEGD